MRVGFRVTVGLLCVLACLLFTGVSGGQTQIPAVPVGLTATPGNAQVGLRWSATANATSYHLKRATDSGGPFKQIAATTYPGYTDVGRTNGVTYFYVVSALDSAGESGNSAQVSAKPSVLATPSGLSATAGDGQVGLRWSAVTGATSYHVKRATVSGGPYALIASPSWYGYTDVGTTNETTYFYVVSAVSTAGESANSAQISVRPTAPQTVPAPAPGPSGSGLPEAFFSLSTTQIDASHYPTVQFGGLRLWDTNTTWAQIETSRGSYYWTDLDTWLRNVSSHGQDAMYTFGRVPHWGSSQPSEACPYLVSDPGCTAPPLDLDSGDNIWKEFVTAVVKHSLSAPELHIAYYEMWNEPDLSRNWTGTPTQLAKMVEDAYAIIHALDPNAKVIGPTPSTANQYGVHFLPDYYAAGAAKAQDIVGLHAYLYSGSTFATSPATITTSISQLQLLMAKYSISSKPIWFTEGSWAGSTTGPTLTDAQKSAYLAQEYMLMWSTGAVSRYYWYAWDAKLGTLWTPSGGMTAAGDAYKLLAGWLIGSTHATNPCGVTSDGTWTCALTLATGYPAEIIWNAGISKTITVDAAFATYRTLTTSTVQSIASHQVSIGPLPVLVVGTQAIQ